MPKTSVNYDQAADYYDLSRGFPKPAVENIAGFIAQKALLTSRKSLLEVGIGTGRISLPLSKYLANLVGIDISPSMLGKLRDKATEEKVSISQADAIRLPFRARSFDSVLVAHVLHRVADPHQVLNEIRRVLKRPGQLIFVVAVQHTPERLLPTIDVWDSLGSKQDIGPINWRTSSAVQQDGGWHKIEEHTLTFPGTINPKILLDAIANRWWSKTWEMPPATLESAFQSVKSSILQEFGENYDVDLVTTFSLTVEILLPVH